MRNPFLLPALILLTSINVEASLNKNTAQQAPEFEVSAKVVIGTLEIKATAPALHHFNIQAPMSVMATGSSSALRPSQAQDQLVIFKIENTHTASYEILLYLCDNAKTFCEKHKTLVSWNREKSELRVESPGTESPHATPVLHSLNSPTGTESNPTSTHEGFIVNQPEEALAAAHQKRKPLLIDFYGIWCPPCNELDEEVFSSPEFQKQSTGFVKLKLDSDSPSSWSLKSKYKVTGYPTVIFASPDGTEISRIIGFRNEQVFLNTMKNAVEFQTPAGDKVNRKIVNSNPERTRLNQLYEKKDKSPKEIREWIQIANKIVMEPELKFEDDEFTHADLWSSIAHYHGELHESKKAKAAWIKAADEFRRKIKSGTERGYNLELAHCLWRAGQFEAAEKIYLDFEKLYPKEFTFYFNHAAMKTSQKKWSESETLGRKALEFSYGDNKLRTTLLIAKTLGAQNRKLEAKKLIEEVLSTFQVPEDPTIRTHQYIKELKHFG